MWTYRIIDNDTGTVLMRREGFMSEEDAELQAFMDARLENVKNFHVSVIRKQ